MPIVKVLIPYAKQFPKGLAPYTTPLEVRISNYDLWRDTTIVNITGRDEERRQFENISSTLDNQDPL